MIWQLSLMTMLPYLQSAKCFCSNLPSKHIIMSFLWPMNALLLFNLDMVLCSGTIPSYPTHLDIFPIWPTCRKSCDVTKVN